MNSKKLTMPVTILVFILVGVASATARTFSLRITVDGQVLPLFVDTDGAGVIAFNTSYAGWTLSGSTAWTKPLMGGDGIAAQMDLYSTTNSNQAGKITIEVSDIGYTIPSDYWDGNVHATGTGTFSTDLYFDNSNTLWGRGTTIANIGPQDLKNLPLSTMSEDFIYSGYPSATPRYSVTMVTTIEYCLVGGHTNFGIDLYGYDSSNGESNGDTSQVPEPSILLLLGLGLAWFGIPKKFKY